MKSNINQLIKEIENKKNELLVEYEKLKDIYGFYFKKWKIYFKIKTKEYNKKFKTGVFKYIYWAKIRHILSMPFIYAMFVPTIILDIFLFVYQNICFRLYGIPLVKRNEYVVYDRKFLDYLNVIQKFNCLYCSYVNWVFSFAVEIWGRTEKYWCPIKYAKKMKWNHNWQKHFADYWDAKWFKECINKSDIFYE